ncbi:calcium-binding protein [Rhizobium alvei]|uniref:Calcium-binding protein n=1 Tax=Rhizobium alvei TaxID=1132659 RepID=A0ABT8YJ06_9HYPH|nr:hypothetical protein [Rhizobium alvei]MDO6963427.1 hypothetical protein [Rhizobium alvei]
MATIDIRRDRTSTYSIDAVGDRFILHEGVAIVAIDVAMEELSTSHDNRIEIRGTLRSDDDCFASTGDNTTFIVAQTGRLFGADGIFTADGAHLVNRGVIRCSDEAITTGSKSVFENFNRLIGDTGVSIDGGRIVNHEGAIIRTSAGGVAIESSISLTVINDGMIQGDLYAIAGGSGQDVVINRGTMEGAIDLGDGNDSFDNRGGTIDGDITGGGGDDVFITDSSVSRLLEVFAGGSDTVRSTVSYVLSADVEKLVLLGIGNTTGKGNSSGNGLTGNSGNNKLFGFANNDFLDGKGGNDTLSGGSEMGDEDTFYFKTGYGRDTIIDFQDDTDKLALKGLDGVTGFNDLKAHHVMENAAGDLVIFSGQDRLIVEDMTITKLTSNDVYFD